jgi:WD40 repeat protein
MRDRHAARRGALSLLALLAPLAACGGGGEATAPASPPTVRTLAYVLNECREDVHGAAGQQALQILRGDGDPVTVRMADTFQQPTGTCALLGLGRFGPAFLLAGMFPRLAVTPDASGVIFEENGDFSVVPLPALPPEQKGIFFIRADGSGLRRVSDASRQASFAFPNGTTVIVLEGFAFSPDGRTIAFSDRGPGPDGTDAIQIETLDIVSGTRTQVTHLPAATAHDPTFPDTCCPHFLDSETIEFLTFANPNGMNPQSSAAFFTIKRDGSGLEAVPVPVVIPGSQLVPIFSITGDRPSPALFVLPGTPVNDLGLGTGITEVFLSDRDNLLQLTDFRRVDTNEPFLSVDNGQVFFVASADPFAGNPSQNCQIFSIGTIGTDLQQLTQFQEGSLSVNGCVFGPPPGCAVGFLGQDPVTDAVVFYSSCDPVGTNPNGGQIFVMRPDGTELRQLTNTRGFSTAADGTIVAELPGPFAYSAPVR